MKKKNNTLIFELSASFLAFVLSFCLFAFVTLVIVGQTLLSPSYLTQQAALGDYFKDLTSETNRSIQDLALASGFPEEVFAEVVTEEMFQKDFNFFVADSFNGKEYQAFETEFDERMDKTIAEYVKTSGKKVNPESETAIEFFKEQAYERYNGFVKLPYLHVYGQKAKAFSFILENLLVVFGVALAFFAFLIFFLNGKWFHRLARTLSYGISAAGLMALIIPGYLYQQKIVSRLAIPSRPHYLLLNNFVQHFFLWFIFCGIVLLLISGVLIFFAERNRKRKKYNIASRESSQRKVKLEPQVLPAVPINHDSVSSTSKEVTDEPSTASKRRVRKRKKKKRTKQAP